MIFKQLLQAEAVDVVQIDSCRLAGVNEVSSYSLLSLLSRASFLTFSSLLLHYQVLSVLLMSAKFGIPVCPHAGGVGLCEYVIHLSLIVRPLFPLFFLLLSPSDPES